MSIEQQLTRLTTARNNIRTALNNKGVAASEHGFEDFASDITAIPQEQDITVEPLTVTENGTYTPETGKAFGLVTVSVADWLQYATFGNSTAGKYGIFTEAVLPEDFYVHLKRAYNLADFCNGATGVKRLTIEVDEGYIASFYRAFSQYGVVSSLEEITIIGNINTTAASSPYAEFLRNATKIKALNFVIDRPHKISSGSNGSIGGTTKLETAYFKPNSATGNFYFAVSPMLTDETIAQIANALVDNGAYTVSLHQTVKDKLDTLMGTVSQVDGHNFFTLSASGDISVASFITQVKGWTVA